MKRKWLIVLVSVLLVVIAVITVVISQKEKPSEPVEPVGDLVTDFSTVADTDLDTYIEDKIGRDSAFIEDLSTYSEPSPTEFPNYAVMEQVAVMSAPVDYTASPMLSEVIMSLEAMGWTGNELYTLESTLSAIGIETVSVYSGDVYNIRYESDKEYRVMLDNQSVTIVILRDTLYLVDPSKV